MSLIRSLAVLAALASLAACGGPPVASCHPCRGDEDCRLQGETCHAGTCLPQGGDVAHCFTPSGTGTASGSTGR